MAFFQCYIDIAQYHTVSKNKPCGGEVTIFSRRVFVWKHSKIYSSGRRPRPRSKNVPANVRTILYKYPLPSVVKIKSRSRNSHSSLYIVFSGLSYDPSPRVAPNAEKSCVPIISFAASFIASISWFVRYVNRS